LDSSRSGRHDQTLTALLNDSEFGLHPLRWRRQGRLAVSSAIEEHQSARASAGIVQ
jgi:hypothetical protein